MKTKYWIAILAAVAVVCLALSLWLFLPNEPAQQVKVLSDGQLLYTLPLSIDTQVTVTTDRGRNVITVNDGKVAVTEADCPDHHCMARGYCHSGTPIVCLPNRLVLEFDSSGAVDGVVG